MHLDIDSVDIDAAAAILRRGGLVAFPTETVYGLGADAANVDALARLYLVKGRPADHPVIVHIAAGADLTEYAREVPDVARALARAFWPGPLTIVLPKRADRVADAATGGRPTVGLRVPDHPVALALLDAFGGGVAAPSANRFGRVSPTTADHVRADLGADVDFVLEGGPSRVGVESTIVDVTGAAPLVLRVGGISATAIEAVIGAPLARRDQGEIAAPGTLASHYAPTTRVEIVAASALAARAEALVASGRRVGVLALEAPDDLAPAVVVLDPPADVDEYAHVLYARLRAADAAELDVLLAVLPPAAGVGAAVRDRLHRAAANPPASRR
jgi:L-threonylcarbamoyladenylate synthase